MSTEQKEQWQLIDKEQWQLFDLVRYLCSRPKMFFENGSFVTGAVFIDGFVMGRGGKAEAELTAFRQWLAERAYESKGVARNLAWSYYVQEMYPEDNQAFAELPNLLAHFLKGQSA